MKKLTALCIIAAIGLQLAGCGEDKNAWIEEGKGKIGATLDCGQFVVDGTVHTFPSSISEWTNNGWHISNNYDNKDTFELEADIISNQFELFSDETEDEFVRMYAINLGTEPAKIVDCTVNEVKIQVADNDGYAKVVLPGGITCKSTKEDVIAAYGEPLSTEDDTLLYTYESQDGLEIEVEIRALVNNVDEVCYTISEKNWGYVGNAEDCKGFINDALKTSFYCDYATYVENKFDTEENAQALYDAEVEYYAQGLMYYLAVDYENVDEGIAQGFSDVAKQVLAKFKWDDPVVDLEEGSTYGSFELTMYPTDFLDIILEDAQAVADSGVDGDEYAQGMLDVVSQKVSEISYKDPVTMTYDIDLDNGVVSNEDWDEIDDILMDYAE